MVVHVAVVVVVAVAAVVPVGSVVAIIVVLDVVLPHRREAPRKKSEIVQPGGAGGPRPIDSN